MKVFLKNNWGIIIAVLLVLASFDDKILRFFEYMFIGIDIYFYFMFGAMLLAVLQIFIWLKNKEFCKIWINLFLILFLIVNCFFILW